MRYLRMLTNAVAGGVLVATYLVVLVLQLNPHVEVVSTTAARWFASLLAFYGPYLGVALFFVLLVRDALSARPLAPAWFSVRLLAWMGAAGAAAAAVVTWANLRGYRAVLSDAAAERMELGATATSVCAALLLSIALARYSFGRSGSRATGTLMVVVMLLSVTVPLYLRGPVELVVPAPQRDIAPREPGARTPRVRVLLLDGASIGFIRQRAAAGQLPNLATVLDGGAFIPLASLQPTQAEPVLTSAATGKFPPKTGVRSNARYRVDDGERAPVDLLPDYCFAYGLVLQGFVDEDQALTAESIRARPFWDIVTDYQLAAGVVGWPLTHPAFIERGYVISDQFDEDASSPFRLARAEAAYPTTAVDIAGERFDEWLSRPWQDVLPASAGSGPPASWISAAWDHAYSEAAAELDQQVNPRVSVIRYQALDIFGHDHLQDAQPERFGELRRDTSGRSVLDQYYAFIDAEVGRAMQRLAPGDLLIVMSGYGMEPTPLSKRLLARLIGAADPPGTHESAPFGFLLAYGANVAPGEYRQGSIVDLAPTVLYYLGLQVGRDMDGFARTDLFRGTFTLDRPVTYIPTHDGMRVDPALAVPEGT